jgi:hypothetical protein
MKKSRSAGKAAPEQVAKKTKQALQKQLQSPSQQKVLDHQAAYKDFTTRLKLLISKNPHLITTTLSNIFTMRLIGNKTHGDLAEIGIAEFINQFMYDFRSVHVGKDLYRKKKREEDINIVNELTKEEFPVSLKAYGIGPLQLSTDKDFLMFPKLKEFGTVIEKREDIARLWGIQSSLILGASMYCRLSMMRKNSAVIFSFLITPLPESISHTLRFQKKAGVASIPCFASLTIKAITFVKSVTAVPRQMHSSVVSGRTQKTANTSRASPMVGSIILIIWCS